MTLRSNQSLNYRPTENRKKLDPLDRHSDGINRMMPYISNDHISKVYNIYAPYIKGGVHRNQKNKDKYGMKGKPYDYGLVYGNRASPNSSVNYGENKAGPKRKLSPINRKNLIMI